MIIALLIIMIAILLLLAFIHDTQIRALRAAGVRLEQDVAERVLEVLDDRHLDEPDVWSAP